MPPAVQSEKLKTKLSALFTFLIITINCIISTAQADILLITHVETPLDSISLKEMRARWLDETKIVKGIRTNIADLSEKNLQRSQFYEICIGMSDRKLKAYWAKRVFIGKGFPPEMLDTPEDMIKWVAEKPGRLGYVDSAHLKNLKHQASIKVIFHENNTQKIKK